MSCKMVCKYFLMKDKLALFSVCYSNDLPDPRKIGLGHIELVLKSAGV